MKRHSLSLPLAASLLACFVAAWTGCGRPAELGAVASAASAEKIRTAILGEGGAAGSQAAAVASTGWGTLQGSFTFAGEAPKLPLYPVNKDEQTCAPGGKAPSQQYLIIDPATKGIANIALIVKKVSRVHESAEPKTEPFVFDQKACVFLTHVTSINVGQTLEIKNSDEVGHNTKIDGQNAFNQTIPAGGTIPLDIKKEDAVPADVGCSIHPWMKSYLLARKNGYFAVTGPDGKWSIPNLPAGEKLEITVWHEHAPGKALALDSPAAKEVKWNKKGKFIVTLQPDEVRELKLEVPPTAFEGG